MKSTIPLFFGLFTLSLLVFGFSVMRNLGYGHVLELRWFNILFLAVGIGMGIQMVKRSFPSKFNYMEGLKHFTFGHQRLRKLCLPRSIG